MRKWRRCSKQRLENQMIKSRQYQKGAFELLALSGALWLFISQVEAARRDSVTDVDEALRQGTTEFRKDDKVHSKVRGERSTLYIKQHTDGNTEVAGKIYPDADDLEEPQHHAIHADENNNIVEDLHGMPNQAEAAKKYDRLKQEYKDAKKTGLPEAMHRH